MVLFFFVFLISATDGGGVADARTPLWQFDVEEPCQQRRMTVLSLDVILLFEKQISMPGLRTLVG